MNLGTRTETSGTTTTVLYEEPIVMGTEVHYQQLGNNNDNNDNFYYFHVLPKQEQFQYEFHDEHSNKNQQRDRMNSQAQEVQPQQYPGQGYVQRAVSWFQYPQVPSYQTPFSGNYEQPVVLASNPYDRLNQEYQQLDKQTPGNSQFNKLRASIEKNSKQLRWMLVAIIALLILGMIVYTAVDIYDDYYDHDHRRHNNRSDNDDDDSRRGSREMIQIFGMELE
eukprot:403350428